MNVSSAFVRAGVACALFAIVTSDVRDADACGGCFHPIAEQAPSVVTDHRMVFKIGTNESVLWDQVRYAGDPREFAWVLPVVAGAHVELSRAEWISALDNASRTTVTGPEIFCNQPASARGTGRSSTSSSSSSSSSSGGVGCGGGASYETTDESAGTGGDEGTRYAGNEDVEVVAQSVIGPYQAVTIRASDGKGIGGWLTDNGFAIPDAVKPVIDGYTRERFDFIALRLRPGIGVRAMRPVRVVMPGAVTTLPLRMVAAGVGARVGLTLWVIGEGRYETSNFPTARVDYGALAWDGALGRSNLSDLTKAALAESGGRGWLTEAAIRTSVEPYSTGVGRTASLADAYRATCATRGARTVPCSETALPPPDGVPLSEEPDLDGDDGGDGGDPDAGDADVDVDAAVTDGGASSDGGAAPKPCTKVAVGCDGFDDLEVAKRGLHAGDVWITRLRADLPFSALDTDLVLHAATTQVEDDPTRHTERFADPSFDPCAGRGVASRATDTSSGRGCACRVRRASDDGGTYLLIGLTIVGAAAVSRSRRRQDR